ncbi:MAG TPA: hypothetical protein VHV74_09765 [Pseudonocardiaceae bacterium]|jgi:hypothetical protein|nr:hypothetical protein [Pseudonocardiaceae bacterium]
MPPRADAVQTRPRATGAPQPGAAARGYLRVEMPPRPDGRRGEGTTRRRIARKVAALFGIPGGTADSDAGAGCSWYASYSTLTLIELRLGGPLVEDEIGVGDTGVFQPVGRKHIPREPGLAGNGAVGTIGYEPISPTAIEHYGPDAKAAIVLSGVNAVLEPLTRALIKVLTEMAFPDTSLLIGTTAMLLSEAFRSQPALMLAGVQAARDQRTTSLENFAAVLAPPVDESPGWQCSRLDVPWTQRARTVPGRVADDETAAPVLPEAEVEGHDPRRPMNLDLVQEVWVALTDLTAAVALRPRQTNRVGIEQRWEGSHFGRVRESALAAARDLTERVLFGLSNEAVGGRTVYKRNPDGTFCVDYLGVATYPARILVDRLTGTHFEDDSYRLSPDSTTSPVPDFNIDRWSRESPLVQRVALWAHHCAERFVVSGGWSEGEPHNRTFAARTDQRARIAEAAAAYFGDDDPLTAELRIFHASYLLEQARRAVRADSYDVQRREAVISAVGAFSDTVDRMVRLHRDGRVLDTHVIESLQPTLMDLASLATQIKDGDPGLFERAADILGTSWLTYIEILSGLLDGQSPAGRDTAQILADLGAVDAARNPTLAAILESSPALPASAAIFHSDPDLAIRIQENTRERRLMIYQIADDWPPYRQSLIDEALLKLRRYRDLYQTAPPTGLLADASALIEYVVAKEFQVQHARRPAVALRPGLPEDAILLAIAEYLQLSADPGSRSRETSGLRSDLLAGLTEFASFVLHRLDDSLWDAAPLTPYRDLLAAAMRRK